MRRPVRTTLGLVLLAVVALVVLVVRVASLDVPLLARLAVCHVGLAGLALLRGPRVRGQVPSVGRIAVGLVGIVLVGAMLAPTPGSTY